MKAKFIFNLLLVAIACFFFASDDPNAVVIIENSTSGIIGSLLGGVTAGISIIFGILSTLKESIPNIANNSIKFMTFLKNLKSDIMILIGCLILSIFIPYLRVVGIPFVSMPKGEYVPSSSLIYTTLELMIIVISMFALIEIISVMFNVFKISMGNNKQEEVSDSNKDN